MHDHFEQGYGGDADVFEMVGVLFPGLLLLYDFLLVGIVAVECIACWVYELDDILELCLISDFMPRRIC